MTQTVERPHVNVAIVTGTSRDVGEFTALGLGQAGWGVLGLYRNPQHDNDQATVVGKLRKDYKVKMSAVRADLVDKATPQLMVEALKEHFDGQAGGLLLGTAGGYNRRIEEAREINVATALKGTFVTRVLERSRDTREMVATWQDTAENNQFPIAMELAVANVKALRGFFPSGHTEYVGIKPQFQLYPPRRPASVLVGAPPMREGSVLSREQIEEIIPHRWPFSFVGGVESIEYGQRATGWMVDLTHPDINWRGGHFPGFEVVPGVIVLEALMQLGAITALGAPEHRGKRAMVTAINEMRYRKPIMPEDDVRLNVEMTQVKEMKGITFGRATLKATNANKVAVIGNISFSLLNPPS